MGVREALPWWSKLAVKLLLARLPIPYELWHRLGLFRHGDMNIPERAIETFCNYYDCARQHASLNPGFESLELGPGDSVLSGLVARAYGAKQAWLVDAGHFAGTGLAACRRTVELLQERGAHPPDITRADNIQEALAQANIRYLTQGTDSLSLIPDASIDFTWSQVVLEHVPKAEMPLFFKHLRRIAKPGGIGVHSIDFRDHLGGGLDNLRFSSTLWESDLFHRSGFYTNRLRPREVMDLFRKSGFSVELLKETRWPKMPIPRRRLAKEFQHLADEDFEVAEIQILVRPI